MKILHLSHSLSPFNVEVHLLQPGQTFPGFGGSRQGLTVRKTASVITRSKDVHGIRDVEWDATDADLWGWVQSLLRNPDFVQTGTIAHDEDAA